MRSFDDYRRTYFQRVREYEGVMDREGPLRLPEAMALRLAWGAETEVFRFPADSAGRAARILYARLTNELLAFVGALRVGSMHGAWHHVRALIEVRATVHHLWLSAPAERGTRIERYLTFLDAVGWLRLQELRNAGDAERTKMFEASAKQNGYAPSADDIAAWSRIFQVDVEKRPEAAKWHAGRLTKLIEECDPSGNARAEYWAYSQATHPSPLGGRLSGVDVRLIGFDFAHLPGAVDAAVLHAFATVSTFDKALGLGDTLRQLVREEFFEFLRVRGHPTPAGV